MTVESSDPLAGSIDRAVQPKPLRNDSIANRGYAGGEEEAIFREATPASEELPKQDISDQISEIVENAKALAETEIAYYRAKLDANVSAAKKIIGLFSIGIAFGTAGLTALVLGALLTLSPIIGPGPATLVVALGFCTLGGLLIFYSVRKARRLPLDRDKL